MKNKYSGKTTGLKFYTFFAILFDVNERLPPAYKRTDKQILDLVWKEFPLIPMIQQFRAKKRGTETVNRYRQRYNKGRFTRYIIPDNMSFRYNGKGQPVEGGRGNRVLTKMEVLAQREAYEDAREELESQREKCCRSIQRKTKSFIGR